MEQQFPTTGTETGDIAAGYIKGGVYAPPGTVPPANIPPAVTSTGGGPTGPATPTTPTSTTPFALAQVMSALELKVTSNNSLMSQRNPLLKQLYDQPLTAEERAQLDPATLAAVDSGDRNKIDMNLRLISDEIQGRNTTLDQSVKYLTDAYQQTLTQAETQKNDAINNILKFVTQYGSNAGEAIKALYGPDYIQKLKDMGIDVDQFAKISPSTISEQRYGVGGVGGISSITIPSGTIAAQTNNPLNIKYSPTSPAGGNDSGIKATDGGTFASFATPEEGLTAAANLLQTNYADLTVDQAMKQWSNNAYGGEVTQVTRTKKIGDLTSNEMAQLLTDMAKRESGASVQYSASDIQEIAKAIETGTQPPDLSRLYGKSAQVRAQLARDGYDMVKATEDWQQITKRIASMNSTQQVRLVQAVNFAYDSLDIIGQLNDAWQGSGFPTFNKATLLAAKSGVTNAPLSKPVTISVPKADGTTEDETITDKQTLATLLDAQISDLTSELGTVYKGGNTSTDESLSLAAFNLSSDWSWTTLNSALQQAKVNLQIRKNSIAGSTVIPGNIYSQGATPTPTPATGGGSYDDYLKAIK